MRKLFRSRLVRPFLILALAINFVSIAPPMAAQETTETPPPVETLTPTLEPTATPVPPAEPVITVPQGGFIIVVVVAGVLLLLFGGGLYMLVARVLKQVPAFLRPGIYAGVESLFSELRRIARETETTADDEQIELFAREWEKVKREVDGTVARSASQKYIKRE